MDARPDYFTEDNQGNEEPFVFRLSKAKTKPAWKFGSSQQESLRFLGYLM
jgi:hypothetical protein